MTSHPVRTPRIRMRFALLGVLVVAVLLGSASSAFAAAFDPEMVITNDNMRAANSMSEKQIQAFLETQSGPLKSLVAKDHNGVKRKASKIIWDACQAWQISPKVMLTMLQKEQSLLTRTSLATNTLKRAIGAGCPDAYTNRYPGFGNQMWHGARLLDSYGEGHPTYTTYTPGMSKKIYKHPDYGTKLNPRNLATYKLYVYNPSVSGNTNFYTIYRRYFGSTFASPRMRPVYRFRNKSNGTYLYTTSIAERHKLRKASYKKRWVYEGAGFSWDTAVPSTQTVPVYRYKNKKTGTFSFSTSTAKYKYRTSAKGKKTWDYQGIAYRVAKKTSSGAVPVYLFKNKKTGGYLFTVKADTVKKYRTAKYKKKWRYEGRVYYLPRAK